MSGEVAVLHVPGHLFQNAQYVGDRQRAARFEGRVIDDRPLVVVRAAVVKSERVRPIGRAVGQPVGDHGPHKLQHLRA